MTARRTRARAFQEVRKRQKPSRPYLFTPGRETCTTTDGRPGKCLKTSPVSVSAHEALTSLRGVAKDKSAANLTRSVTTQTHDRQESLNCFDWCKEEHQDKIRASTGPKDGLPEAFLDSFEELKVSNLIADRRRREREEEERKQELEKQRAEEARRLAEEEEQRLKDEEERVARLRSEARQRVHLRAPNCPLFPPLSPDWAARVHAAHTQDSRGPVAKSLEADLLRHDFARLVPPTVWLNDSVVNGSLLWLDKFVNEAAGIIDVKAQTRKCLVLGSFFFKRLTEQGVKQTERTLRRHGVHKHNLLDLDIIMLPVCEANHWTLMVVHPKLRTIAHLDSLNPRGHEPRMSLVLEWIKTILGDLFLRDEWRFVKYSTPPQTNGYDCGVHTILNGMCLALGLDPVQAYSSDELPKHRENIAAVLLNNGFKEQFSLQNC
ncbi:hypothetical protein jhhlp_004293 [Lomentospora prolificans]|uniref:Ubiquitin-like protease family profile domain-containing protein n=1 Tax=Lomentospora prolificans TaxID=41688 RepID=A0A2N3NB67_9PEZI|nr:hypothetical protein jhhlp_004293 [Lomentospora prolificans]